MYPLRKLHKYCADKWRNDKHWSCGRWSWYFLISLLYCCWFSSFSWSYAIALSANINGGNFWHSHSQSNYAVTTGISERLPPTPPSTTGPVVAKCWQICQQWSTPLPAMASLSWVAIWLIVCIITAVENVICKNVYSKIKCEIFCLMYQNTAKIILFALNCLRIW